MNGVIAVVVVALALLFGSPGRADDPAYGSEAEARGLVQRGIDHVRAVGMAQALADFNDRKGAFVDRDLYLIVTDLDGRRLAHGANPRLIGLNIVAFPDATGKAYGREIVEGARGAGSGWVDYVFADPLTGRLMPKSSYFERAGEVIVYCGVYKR